MKEKNEELKSSSGDKVEEVVEKPKTVDEKPLSNL